MREVQWRINGWLPGGAHCAPVALMRACATTWRYLPAYRMLFVVIHIVMLITTFAT